MLIEFSVGNYLSIKDRQTLRLDASSISEYKDQLIDAGRYQLLRSAVIYGANASGKSNVLKAIATMRRIVLSSAQRSSAAEIEVEPFLLSTETENAPSYFEIIFLLKNIRYRYGFEVDQKAVRSEWLFELKKKQEKPLFLREEDGIDVSKNFKEGQDIEDKTRNNALFLAICDQFNGSISKQIMAWFTSLMSLSGLHHENYAMLLSRFFAVEDIKDTVMNLIKMVDLGFTGIEVESGANSEKLLNALRLNGREDVVDLVENQLTKSIKTIHHKYDSEQKLVGEVLFDFHTNESEGTKKFLDIIVVLCVSLMTGKCVLADELDAKLHPLMTQAIIRLFNDPVTNPNNAQLIFATHDTNLLAQGGFRRDQIYFTEKDQYGATCLYSLVEYQEQNGDKVRKDRSFEKDYIQGRYGAIPFIGDLSKLVPAWHEK